jgi:hypothetical protein
MFFDINSKYVVDEVNNSHKLNNGDLNTTWIIVNFLSFYQSFDSIV